METILLEVVIGIHAIASPYTKVEESFNLQAIHDFLHWFPDISRFDHLEFPGVVDRSATGAFIVSLLARPLIYLSQLFRHHNKLHELIIVRLSVGLMTAWCLRSLIFSIRSRYGRRVSTLYVLLMASQFHINYYASRTLPNTFAFMLIAWAIGEFIGGQSSYRRWICAMVVSVVVFRIELFLFVGPFVLLSGVLFNTSSFGIRWNIVGFGVKCAFLLIVTSALFDSWFWQRWTWPELSSVQFNIISNRSHEYGTHPYHYYFTVVSAKLLLFAYPWLIVALISGQLFKYRIEGIKLLAPVGIFMGMYSILPHKELRFVIYVPVILNLFVALSMHSAMLNNRFRVWFRLLISAVLIGNLCVSSLLLFISSGNYAGGQAMTYLNRNILPFQKYETTVHVDVFTAMTGFSRFLEEDYQQPLVRYDKNETVSDYSQMDFVVMEYERFQKLKLSHIFEIIHRQAGYSHISISKLPSQWRINKKKDELQLIFMTIHYNPSLVVVARQNMFNDNN